MKYGDRIIIDRKTGEVLQLERVTPEGMQAAARVLARILIENLMAEAAAKAKSSADDQK